MKMKVSILAWIILVSIGLVYAPHTVRGDVVIIPHVQSRTIEDAMAALYPLPVIVHVVYVDDLTVPHGVVMQQHPAVGSFVEENTVVVLNVSRWAGIYDMPEPEPTPEPTPEPPTEPTPTPQPPPESPTEPAPTPQPPPEPPAPATDPTPEPPTPEVPTEPIPEPPTIEPPTEYPTEDPTPISISPEQQLVEDFLIQFPTIFLNTWTYAPQMWEGMYPFDFDLYDFNNDGIPAIIIHYRSRLGTAGGVAPSRLFKFVDGAYQPVSTRRFFAHDYSYEWLGAPHVEYFTTNDGNLVMHGRGLDIMWYEFIAFDGVSAAFTQAAATTFQATENDIFWHNYFTETINIPVDDFYLMQDPAVPRTIPGMDTSIAPIPPMDEMKAAISTTLTARVDEIFHPVQYIYSQPTHRFEIQPADLAWVTDPNTAQIEIVRVANDLTPEQRTSGDVLNHVTLYIENINRRGVSINTSSPLHLDAALMRSLATSVDNVHNNTATILNSTNIAPLRNPRKSINFISDARDAMDIIFQDDAYGIDFDSVTVETHFANITIHHQYIQSGNEISIGRANAAYEAAQLMQAQIQEDSDTSLPIFLQFWSVGVLLLLCIAWKLTAEFSQRAKKIRTIAIPALAAVAIAANILTFTGAHDSDYSTLDAESLQNAAQSNEITNQTGDDESLLAFEVNTSTPLDAVELIMSHGMKATLSLPVNLHNPEFLVIANAQGEIQTSIFNPATHTIDAMITANGIYHLRETEAHFADIAHKNPMIQAAIIQLASRGIMRGASETDFRPDSPMIIMDFEQALSAIFPGEYTASVSTEHMTKGQMAAMIGNFLMTFMDYYPPQSIEEILSIFEDHDTISNLHTAWEAYQIALAVQTDILLHRTDNHFAPESTVTRGDAAVLLYRLYSRVW